MESHDFKQGSPEWHAHRATHLNASDAPAMLGCSPYMTRTQLLHRLHTGLAAEVDPATQRRFDDGHRFEALARPIAEKLIGEDLYPVTGSEGELSASFDGLTLMEDTAFEHKTLNDELRACMKDQGNGYGLPKRYQVQMEQQLMVSGAERVLFMASKWDGDELVEERHCWYASDPALRAEIIAGWKQFAVDLAAYVPTEAAPVVVAQPMASLPAVSVRVDGALAVISNLPSWGVALREFIAKIPAKPETDQQFADCDSACKKLKEAEQALDAAEANALGQITSVEEMTRMVADLRTLARTTRLASEKMVTARKLQIRTEEVQRGKDAFAAHIASLNERLGRPYMPAIAVDFAAAISGKKNIDSLRNAIDSELARGKIAAHEIADRLDLNLQHLRQHAADFAFLFADTAQIIQKPADDLRVLVKSRIIDHKNAEQKKADDLREQIRAEEAAKLLRAAHVQRRIDAFATAGEPLEGRSADEIASILRTVQATVLTPDLLDDRVADAQAAKNAALERLNKAFYAESQRANEEARLAAEAAKPAATPAPAPIASPAVSSNAAAPIPSQPLTAAKSTSGPAVVPIAAAPPAGNERLWSATRVRIGLVLDRMTLDELFAVEGFIAERQQVAA
jgi:putative phage-type endonuclease